MCTKVEDFVKAIEECQGAVEKLTEHAYQDILLRNYYLKPKKYFGDLYYYLKR